MTLSPAAPGSSFFYPHSLSHNIYFSSSLTHFLTISIFHPHSLSHNIHFSSSFTFCQYQIFTLELALPIINPHFCTCAARSTATGTRRQDHAARSTAIGPRRQDHGSWSTAAGFGPQVFGQQVCGQQDHGSSCASRSRPVGFRPAGPRPANLIFEEEICADEEER